MTRVQRDVSGEVVDELEVLNAARSGDGLENDVVFARRAQAVATATAAVVARLDELERLLILIDRVLRVSQPPIIGKIGLRWWLRNGSDEIRHPVLVTWVRLRNGRWRSKRLPQVRRDRISKEGTSGMNHEETYHLALLASRLIKVYDGLVAQLGMSITALNRSHDKTGDSVKKAGMLIRVAHKQVMTKLLNAGYEVDKDTMSLVDRAGL